VPTLPGEVGSQT